MTVCSYKVSGCGFESSCGNKIIFTITDANLHGTVVTLSGKHNPNYEHFLVKDLKDQFMGTNIKQKVRIKIKQMNRYFLVSNFVVVNRLFVLLYPNQDDASKRFTSQRYFCQKALSKVIMWSSMEENFMVNQALLTYKTIWRN